MALPSASAAMENISIEDRPRHDFKYQFKILMLGDTGVGKTSLLNRFVHDKFNMTFISTIGIDYKYKTVIINDGEGSHAVRLVLWDTAGQERFRTITRQYYRGAQGVVLMYDSTNRATFENVGNWLSNIEQSGSAPEMALTLVANKCDLPNQVVSVEEGQALAKQRRAQFFRTSAKDDMNVGETFMSLTREIERKIIAQRTVDTPEKRPDEVVTIPRTISLRDDISKGKQHQFSCCAGAKIKSKQHN